MYRKGLGDCVKPVGVTRNETAATFTMVHCAETNAKARADAEESFVWYPKTAARHIASLAEWMEEEKRALGNYQYAGDLLNTSREGLMDFLDMNYLWDSGAAVVGDPDRCIELAKRYEAVGCDLLLCLFNPYKIPHEDVMQSIELMGTHVLPAFE